MAIALKEESAFKKQHTKAEKLDFLSRHLRSDAGSAFANIFRSDHELSYFKVLEDVVEKAASAASWKSPTIDDAIPVERLEDYILHAFAFTERESKAARDSEEARRTAERILTGTVTETETSTAGRSLVVAGAGAAGAALLGTGPLLLALVAAGIAGPAVRRTLPAVLILIHIRNRVRVEKTLEVPS
jgi:hypothetical protein